jgi:hypothetical protein
MAVAAQAVVDAWEQDEDGVDEELGTGGVCDRVTDAMRTVIASALPDVDIQDGGQEGDDHAFLLVDFKGQCYVVDVPPGVYETGGGYVWRKIQGARITAADIVIEPC